MAKEKKQLQEIPDNTPVELISIKGEKVYKKILSFSEANLIINNQHKTIKKKSGWKYQIFQLGFSQFSNAIKI